MQKKNIYTLVLLLLLTITTALISNNFDQLKIAIIIILTLSGIKFLTVVFQFMELNRAHQFWKVLIIGFLSLFIGIISIVL